MNPPSFLRELSNNPPSRRIWHWMLLSLLIHLVAMWGLLQVETGTDTPRQGNRKSTVNSSSQGKQTPSRGPHPDVPGSEDVMKGAAVRAGREGEKRGIGVQGRLAVKGKSTAGFRITAKRARGGAVVAEAQVDASGRFLLRLLPSGSYELNLTHEGRVLSRIRLEIKAGTVIGLEWNPDLSARRIPVNRDFSPQPLTPEAFWEMVRDPSARRWRRNLESMLVESGVSSESIRARRRAEYLWIRVQTLREQVFRRMIFMGVRVFHWLNATGMACCVK